MEKKRERVWSGTVRREEGMREEGSRDWQEMVGRCREEG